MNVFRRTRYTSLCILISCVRILTDERAERTGLIFFFSQIPEFVINLFIVNSYYCLSYRMIDVRFSNNEIIEPIGRWAYIFIRLNE